MASFPALCQASLTLAHWLQSLRPLSISSDTPHSQPFTPASRLWHLPSLLPALPFLCSSAGAPSLRPVLKCPSWAKPSLTPTHNSSLNSHPFSFSIPYSCYFPSHCGSLLIPDQSMNWFSMSPCPHVSFMKRHNERKLHCVLKLCVLKATFQHHGQHPAEGRSINHWWKNESYEWVALTWSQLRKLR